ncbi:MAG: hypothetical protein AAF478_14285 [Pseudomonadota bacterium]
MRTRSRLDNVVAQEAHDRARGMLLFLPGRYRLRPTDLPYSTFSALTNDLYRSIRLHRSNMVVEGFGATIHCLSRIDSIPEDIQPAFATDKNTHVADLENLTFIGMSFDLENDGDVNGNQRAIHPVGVRGLRYLFLKAHSSGDRRGYFSHIHHCEDIQIVGYRHDNLSGGINFRFCRNLVVSDFAFRNFSEAFDFDGAQYNAIVRNGHFEGKSRTEQCIDLNNHDGASIGDFTAIGVGNIILINHKPSIPDNYEDFINGSFVKNIVRSRNIIVSNIVAKHTGSATQPSIYIGWDWNAGSLSGIGPVKDVKLENITLTDHGYILVRECEGLRIKDVETTRGLSTSGAAAVQLQSSARNSDEIGWSDLDVEIERLTVTEASHAALFVIAPRRLKIDGLRTYGNYRAGSAGPDVRITALEARACNCSLDNMEIEGDLVLNGNSDSVEDWSPSTLYKRNAIVTCDGGKFYKAISEGLSAVEGGPRGSGNRICDDGSASVADWVANKKYIVDDTVRNGPSYYVCVKQGISSAGIGPTGADQRIQDNTVVWRPLDGVLCWKNLRQLYTVNWGRNNSIGGKVHLQGDVGKHITGELAAVFLGEMPAKGYLVYPALVAQRKSLITQVSMVSSAPIQADTNNYRTFIVNRVSPGPGSEVGVQLLEYNVSSTDLEANRPIDIDIGTATDSISVHEPHLEVGDMITLESRHAGRGLSISGLTFFVRYIEF